MSFLFPTTLSQIGGSCFQFGRNAAFSLMATVLLGSAAQAHGVTVGNLEIIHPNIPAPIASAKSAAGYMGISNEGTTADRLIGIEVPTVAKAMLHTTVHQSDGVAKMMHLDAIDLPPGETVLLEPGGMHVMLMGLQAVMTEGQMVPATLIFEHAGRVEVEFMVDPPNGVDHSTMDHSAMGHGQADGPMSVMGGTDAEQITALLMAQFDRPDAPLTVAPITVQGTVAVAGWSQDGMGGRAFLRRDAEGWFVELCSGESLVQPATFVSMGLSQSDAELLAAAVNGAEASAGAELISKLNAFEGTVVIGRAGMAAHGHASGHGHAHGASN